MYGDIMTVPGDVFSMLYSSRADVCTMDGCIWRLVCWVLAMAIARAPLWDNLVDWGIGWGNEIWKSQDGVMNESMNGNCILRDSVRATSCLSSGWENGLEMCVLCWKRFVGAVHGMGHDRQVWDL